MIPLNANRLHYLLTKGGERGIISYREESVDLYAFSR